MQSQTNNHDNLVNVASLRFKPLVVEATQNDELTIKLKLEPGVDGFIVFLKPMLPSIR